MALLQHQFFGIGYFFNIVSLQVMGYLNFQIKVKKNLIRFLIKNALAMKRT
jgi:hypothetical protein